MNLSEWFLIFLILISIFGIVVAILRWNRPKRKLSKKFLNTFARTSLDQYTSYIGRQLLMVAFGLSEVDDQEYYLCYASAEFKKIWDKYRSQIKQLANEFLIETGFTADSWHPYILFCVPSYNVEDNRKVRFMFLEWLIKKTE